METTNIYSALALFREIVSAVKKDADNPFYKSKYADLPSILEVIKQPLKESGLAITHHCKNTDGSFSVITTLAHHSTAETIDSEFPVFGSKPQEIGSSMSYARRYNLLALLDIPTEDDDGNTANTASRTTGEKIQEKKWFNFSDLELAIKEWFDTDLALRQYIKDFGFTCSAPMWDVIKKYLSTGELIKPEFKK